MTSDVRDAQVATAVAEGTWVAGLLMGSLGAALAVVPAALRVSQAGATFVVAWLVLWGSAALLVSPFAGALRLARPLSPGLRALLGGALLAAAPLMVFARVLKVSTHHRPLGGVTFTLVALCLLLVFVACAGRLESFATTGIRRRILQGVYVVAGLAALRFLQPLISGEARAMGYGAGVLDAALLLGVALVAGLAPAPAVARRRLLGPLFVLLPAAAGFALAGGDAYSLASVPYAIFSALGR